MYQNYIFDLYGTLVDIQTDEEKPEFWKKIAKECKRYGAEYDCAELKLEYHSLVMNQERILAQKTGIQKQYVEIVLDDVFKTLFSEKGVELTDHQLQKFGLTFRKLSTCELCLFPKAKDMLLQLRAMGKRVYLLSNAQRIFTMPEMKELGIYELFDGILYSSDAGIKKPYQVFYQLLFERYGLKKEESVMIGNDCIADIQSAHDFGIDSMYVHTRQSTPLNRPLPDNCRVLDNIGEV